MSARSERFPNYTRIAPKVPHAVWRVARPLSVLTLIAIVALLLVAPSAGLDLWWGLLVPALPLLWFVAPGIWRNVCPLAATNQVARTAGFSRAATAPEWFRQAAPLIGMTLFFAAVAARPVWFNDSGAATAALILAALVGAFIGGYLLKGKSGWCASICPMLPVQRVYGQTPFVLERNDHCRPCVGCTRNCYDFNPRAAYLADLREDEPGYSGTRKLFVGAFPAVVIVYFTTPGPDAAGIGEHFARMAVAIAAGIGSFFAAEAILRVRAARLAAVYGAAAITLFYWYVTPGIAATLTGEDGTPWIVWPLRATVGVLALAWVVRTWRQEQHFEEALDADAGQGWAVKLGASAQAAAAAADGVELTFERDGTRIVARPQSTLLEVAEGHDQPLEAGCRMGVCGADPVAVLEGAENLSAPTDDERATLERLGLDPGRNRLACCARVDGPVTISLTPDREAAAQAAPAVELAGDPAVREVVVLGNGIAGVTAADHVRRRHHHCEISVIAAEAHPLYNRMGISRLIDGRGAMTGLHLLPDAWYADHRITCWLNTRATMIDREKCRVRLGTGETLHYDRLILATGSAAFVPPLPRWGLAGTFVLRAADDALQIRSYAQCVQARRAIVAGGGLLGLEAAYALHKLGLKVTVLERGPWLLRRQLDARAADLLRVYLTNLGLEIHLDAEAERLIGTERLEGVGLCDGREIPAEVLLVAAGVVPVTDLARAAGLEVGRGVVVDEQLRTSDPRIFAVGDAVEWNGTILGLWPIAVEQAEVAAENAVGGSRAYRATVPITMLKVLGVELTSVGRIDADASQEEREHIVEDTEALRYRKIVVDAEQRCVGAILLGFPRDAPAVTAAVKAHAPVEEALAGVHAPA